MLKLFKKALKTKGPTVLTVAWQHQKGVKRVVIVSHRIYMETVAAKDWRFSQLFWAYAKPRTASLTVLEFYLKLELARTHKFKMNLSASMSFPRATNLNPAKFRNSLVCLFISGLKRYVV